MKSVFLFVAFFSFQVFADGLSDLKNGQRACQNAFSSCERDCKESQSNATEDLKDKGSSNTVDGLAVIYKGQKCVSACYDEKKSCNEAAFNSAQSNMAEKNTGVSGRCANGKPKPAYTCSGSVCGIPEC